MGLVVLKVPGDDLEWGGNSAHKDFSQVRNGGLIAESIIFEFLPEFL